MAVSQHLLDMNARKMRPVSVDGRTYGSQRAACEAEGIRQSRMSSKLRKHPNGYRTPDGRWVQYADQGQQQENATDNVRPVSAPAPAAGPTEPDDQASDRSLNTAPAPEKTGSDTTRFPAPAPAPTEPNKQGVNHTLNPAPAAGSAKPLNLRESTVAHVQRLADTYDVSVDTVVLAGLPPSPTLAALLAGVTDADLVQMMQQDLDHLRAIAIMAKARNHRKGGEFTTFFGTAGEVP